MQWEYEHSYYCMQYLSGYSFNLWQCIKMILEIDTLYVQCYGDLNLECKWQQSSLYFMRNEAETKKFLSTIVIIEFLYLVQIL